MMLHPATAHFAIALPLVAAVIGAIYMVKRDSTMAKLSSFAIVITAVAIGVAWYSGNQAGPKIFDFLSEAGKHELLEHKEMGLYLAIAMSIIAVVKIIGCQMKKFALEAAAIVATFVIAGAVLLQGKDGGEIVYEYGQPFKAHLINSTLKDAVATAEEEEECDAKVEAYEDAMDSVESVNSDVNEALGIHPEEKEAQEEEEEE